MKTIWLQTDEIDFYLINQINIYVYQYDNTRILKNSAEVERSRYSLGGYIYDLIYASIHVLVGSM